ncbi:MAG: hypothetical protein JW818_10115 [Pirellulales bacterium]|nr:hypothetical protein [Pirellulales bacterium]
MCFSTLPVWADARPARTLDEQLLDDLGDDPVDPFDRELFGRDKAKKPKAPPAKKPESDLEKRLRNELGEAAAPGEDSDPVLGILRQMRQAERRIAQADCGRRTQETQQDILAELDKMIEQAKKSCSGSAKCSAKPSSKPCDKPGSKPGQKPGMRKPGQATPTNPEKRNPDANKLDPMKALWGHLPQHERQRMLELPVDEFLPEYELLIEEYFRQLSEEK